MDNFFHIDIVQLGIGLIAAGYLFTYWKQGGNKASSDVIVAYKEQVGINANRITELTRDLGVLTGQVKEKDERIKMLEALVQGRSPEQAQYMTDMRKFTQGVAEYMDSSTQTLGEVSVYMHNLNNPSVESA